MSKAAEVLENYKVVIIASYHAMPVHGRASSACKATETMNDHQCHGCKQLELVIEERDTRVADLEQQVAALQIGKDGKATEAIRAAMALLVVIHDDTRYLSIGFARACAEAADTVDQLRQQVAALQLAGGAAVAKLLPPTCRNCGHPLTPANERIADGCPCNSPRGINHGLVPTHVCTCHACDPAQTGSVRLRETDALRARVAELEGGIVAEARRTTKTIEIYENTLCAIGVALGKPDPTDIVSTLRARLKELIDEKQKRLAAESRADQAHIAYGQLLDETEARKKDHSDCQRKLAATEADLARASMVLGKLASELDHVPPSQLAGRIRNLRDNLFVATSALQRIEAVVTPDTAPINLEHMSPSQVADKVRELRDELLVTQNTLRTLEKIMCDLLAARSTQSWPEHRHFDALIAFFAERYGKDSGQAARNETEASHATSPGKPGDSPALTRADLIDALEFALRLAHGLNTANMLKNLIQYLKSGA